MERPSAGVLLLGGRRPGSIAEPTILQAIVGGKGPRRARFTVGYAGWAPGQLEAEMREGSWIAVPSDDAIVFDDAYDTKWDRPMAKRKISL